MIPYIDAQLQRWAAWLKSGRTRLGYPGRSAFVAAMGGGRSSVPMIPDDEAMSIGSAVNALEPRLKSVVDCYYRTMTGCTVEQMANELGIHRDTVYDRIDTAHQRIQLFLDELKVASSH